MMRFYSNARSLTARPKWLLYIVAVCFVVCVARLFQLQVLDYDVYSEQAKAKHVTGMEIQARRGEIYVKDYHTGEPSLLATNISLDLLYVDPVEIDDPARVVNALTPFLFDADAYRSDLCESNTNCREAKAEGLAIDILEQIEGMSEQDLEQKFKDELLDKISSREVSYTLLGSEVGADAARQIADLRLTGVYVEGGVMDQAAEEPKTEIESLIGEAFSGAAVEGMTEEEKAEAEAEKEVTSVVWANPILVANPKIAAEELAPILGKDADDLEYVLTRRTIRYVKLANKIPPEISDQIRAMKLDGVGLTREHWRYYPEGSLAAQVLGFVNREGYGQYGVEGAFNEELEGKKGLISAETDRMGRLLPSSETEIKQAEDGVDLVLTIDRSVQAKVEEILKAQVDKARADGGEVVVMDPWTGGIIALAEYPSFDPNNYGDVYQMEPLYAVNPPKQTMDVIEDEEGKRWVYANERGAAVYRLKSILDIYEPGSTFKALIVAAGIDAGLITPQTPFNDAGPVVVDDYTIHNSEARYYGQITITEVLKYSLNTGMTFIAQKMGGQLMYEYITKFGFGELTDIEFEGELAGQLENYRSWAPTELATKSFGQGIAVTPIQMAVAYSALANGGYLLEPHVLEEKIYADGTKYEYGRQVVRRVITEDTSAMISAMLVTSVDSGVAKGAKIPGYLIAGKTGTSQIAKGGGYEKGEGTTIASFAGYAPANDPKFVIIVKIDRPRTDEWGSTNAVPIFKEVTRYLLDYYAIAPSS